MLNALLFCFEGFDSGQLSLENEGLNDYRHSL